MARIGCKSLRNERSPRHFWQGLCCDRLHSLKVENAPIKVVVLSCQPHWHINPYDAILPIMLCFKLAAFLFVHFISNIRKRDLAFWQPNNLIIALHPTTGLGIRKTKSLFSLAYVLFANLNSHQLSHCVPPFGWSLILIFIITTPPPQYKSVHISVTFGTNCQSLKPWVISRFENLRPLFGLTTSRLPAETCHK